MKIRKLHIKNYKIFNDIELDFTDAHGKTLDKVVLAGVNGCGKTTVLEIIKKMYDRTLSDYFKSNSDGFIKVEIELSDLEKTNIKKTLNIILDIPEINSDYTTNRDLLINLLSSQKYTTINYNSKSSNKGLESLIFTLNDQDNKKKLLYLPTQISNESIIQKKTVHEVFEVIHLSSDKNTMKELALKDIRNEIFKNEDIAPRKSKEKAIKRITKALNGLELTTKLVDLDSEELIFESANGKKIKFEELSNGEQTLYFRAIYLSTLNPQNSIIMIDEPEESLHPTWQQKVLKLYQNIGENNQVIVATHSPHIIGSSNAEEVFLLEIDGKEVEAEHPRYTKGHSIDYILEVMGANPRDTSVINTVDDYLALVRKGLHETEMGLALKAEIDALNLDPNSAEMRHIDLSLKRFNAVGV